MGGDSGIPFGNYTLLRRIARGGMAEVFVARQEGIDGFDRLVAIKRILPHLLDDQSFVGMFRAEARLAARLSHPNVIHIYDFGKVDEHFFIAMEFMHGLHAGDLIRLAEEKPMPAELVARIGADACAGLHYAHNRRDQQGAPLKLVHRDVSPPNLLVSYDGIVKIVDFGIAKAVSSIEQTRPGIVKGKYAYMSPEQTTGQPLDGRSDVFSLGLVLWELLSGKPAVTRTDQVLAMKTIRDGKVPAIESVRTELPDALAEAMRGALQKDPSKRSDARTFGNALESFLKGSSEIASSVELGIWLTERSPPTENLGPEVGSELLPQIEPLEPTRDRTESRGSVVRALPGEHFADSETTRSLAASGKLDADLEDTIPPLLTDTSVLIDRSLMPRGRRRPDSDYVVPTNTGVGALDFVEEEEETAIVFSPDDAIDENSDEFDALETYREPPSAKASEGADTPAADKEPAKAVALVDTNHTYTDNSGPHYGHTSNTGPIAPERAQPQPLTARSKKMIWMGLGGLAALLCIVALVGGGDSPKPDGTPAQTESVGTSADVAGPKSLPAMLVTPLLDGGTDTGGPPTVVELQTDARAPETRDPKHRSEKKGRLEVVTSPDSLVYHRGRMLGATPMTLPLRPGRYRLLFKSPKHNSVKKIAVIRGGKTTKLEFALTALAR